MELNLITQNFENKPRRVECTLEIKSKTIQMNIFDLENNQIVESISIPFKSMKSFIKQSEEQINLSFDLD